MTENNTDPKEELVEYLKSEISKSGFPLEIKTAIILKKNGWKVSPHILYGF